MSKKYEVIYADPPWYERGGGKIKRGADKHYPLMKTSEILDLSDFIKEHIAKDSFLFLWVTNNFLPDGIQVLEHWGFRYLTNLVWVKNQQGLGFYLRGKHELLLIGSRGRPEHSKQIGTRAGRFIPPSVLHADKKKHSEKPEEVIDIIEQWSKGPYLEMFARKQRLGWDVWGNEVFNSI